MHSHVDGLREGLQQTGNSTGQVPPQIVSASSQSFVERNVLLVQFINIDHPIESTMSLPSFIDHGLG